MTCIVLVNKNTKDKINIKKHVFIYCRELAPDTFNLTGDRVRGDDSTDYAIYSIVLTMLIRPCDIVPSKPNFIRFLGVLFSYKVWY